MDGTGSASRAVAAVARRAGDDRVAARRRWSQLVDQTVPVEHALATAGRLTVNFHPDRIAADGRSVAAGLASTGGYVSQWVSRISSGGRSAFRGGDRHRWESSLFGTAYDDADPHDVAFPLYGALDLLGDPHGGSPRFGSAFLVLADHVRARATFTVGDSHAGPTDVGTLTEPWSLLAGLAEQARAGRLLDRSLDLTDLHRALTGRHLSPSPARLLDGYVEAQVHGGIDLAADVEAIVADPSFRGEAVERDLATAAQAYGFDLHWHGGSEIDADDVPGDFRGPTMPALARRVARPDGIVDAAAIGRAAATLLPGPMQTAGDPPQSAEQQLKYLWHVLLALGHDS